MWTKEWDAPNEIFGALVPIYGTLVTSFIALLIAVPVSFGIALFLTELSPAWLKRPLGIAIELLAAIPSIVYGMWGLFIFAPLFATYFQEPVGNVLSTIPFVGALFAGPAFGIGILAAGVILAIMIIPYIAAVMRDVFEQTPVMMKESGLRYRLYDLGGYLAYRPAIYQERGYRRRDARSGARAGGKPWR
ncbi:Phosphate transport system permease protein pstC [Raoultella planticola]|uniref:Phosphate transport system permease protein pstC n=1 Tax=Raoultella planticola TaxID=575 RepID=A0A485BH95_RAOPL|nr:Phosphate transport system permease protein pstC [Raoultella planticola]